MNMRSVITISKKRLCVLGQINVRNYFNVKYRIIKNVALACTFCKKNMINTSQNHLNIENFAEIQSQKESH